MCRYAMHPAKSHYVCFPCRFTSKPKRQTFDWDAMTRPGWHCPHCGEQMVDVGKDFKAPRRSADAQWRKIKMLVDAGIDFDSCGCGGPGYRPRTLSDAKTEMKQRRTDRKAWEPRRRPLRGGYYMGKYSKYLRELGT